MKMQCRRKKGSPRRRSAEFEFHGTDGQSSSNRYYVALEVLYNIRTGRRMRPPSALALVQVQVAARPQASPQAAVVVTI